MEVISVVPENLSLIIENQEKRREEHLVEIGAHPEWQERRKLIHDSINIIYLIAVERKHQTDDELVLTGTGTLLFRDCSIVYGLILGGLYRAALMPLRDMFECALLLEKFTLDRPSIQRWKKARTKQEEEEFKPYAVRDFLEKRKDSHPSNQPKITYMYHLNIKDMYYYLCKLGAHPTYVAIANMLCKNNLLHPTPFLAPNKLKIVLIEFARIAAFSASCLLDAFGIENIESRLHLTIFDFKKTSHVWFTKHGSFA